MNFARLATFLDQLEATSSRNQMVEILAELFREAVPEEVDKVVYLCQGRLGPPYQRVEFGVGEAAVRSALASATDTAEAVIRRRYAEVGDYGTIVEQLFSDRPESDASVEDVYAALDRVAKAEGKGSQAQKRDLVVALLAQSGPTASKHILRILLGRLRIGVGDPTMMEGLSFAHIGSKQDRKSLERAYNLCSDLGLVAATYLKGGGPVLDTIHVQVGRPVRPALCERVSSPEELIEKLGRCAVEPKIDGFRCQVHKQGQVVRAFSRNLEDMSAMFPEIVEAVRRQAGGHDLILEGEAVGYDPDTLEFHPFQVTVSRKRKHGIEELREQLPLKLLAFDVLSLDGTDLTPRSYAERRRTLLDLLGEPIDFTVSGAAGAGPVIQPNEVRELETPEEVDTFFATTVERGQEGIVAKRLDSPYQAGARNYNWIKLKRSYRGELKDTVDCVVVGYWYGKGNRARLGIGTVLTAVYDKERDVFTTVTRLGTGFSEEQWVALRELLDASRDGDRPARVDSLLEPDVWCTPTYVIEIQADEITRSPMHTTGRREGDFGYALRFPRVVGFVRADRRPEDATTVEEIVALHQKQGQRQVGSGG